MTHTPPVPPGNQSPYPVVEPPHVKAPKVAAPAAPAPARMTQRLVVGALVGAAALAWGAFFLRGKPAAKPARKAGAARK